MISELTVVIELWFSSRYQRECAELSQWLQPALERLEFWNTQAVLVPQELETVRDHLAAFLVRPQICFSFLFFFLKIFIDPYRFRLSANNSATTSRLLYRKQVPLLDM